MWQGADATQVLHMGKLRHWGRGWVWPRSSSVPVPRNGPLPRDSGGRDSGDSLGMYWMFLGGDGNASSLEEPDTRESLGRWVRDGAQSLPLEIMWGGSKCGHLGWGKPRLLGDGAGQGPVAAQLFALKSLWLTWRFLESGLDPGRLELSDLRMAPQLWFRQPWASREDPTLTLQPPGASATSSSGPSAWLADILKQERCALTSPIALSSSLFLWC